MAVKTKSLEGIGDFLKGVLADDGQGEEIDQKDPTLELLAASGIITKGIRVGTPEYVELLATTDWDKVKKAADTAKKAQEERSKKYGISIKDGGNVTKPSEFSDVPDEEWADPVNYRYPMGDEQHANNAASRWGDADNRKQYSPEEQKTVGRRIRTVQKKYQQNKEAFKEDPELRAERSGITVKAFFTDESIPDDDSAIEPTAYADFTNYSLRIDSPEALNQSKTEYGVIKRFSPDTYTEAEQKLIEQAFEHASKRFEGTGKTPPTESEKKDKAKGDGNGGSDKPQMVDCPHCGKPVPEGTTECPHCGKAIPGGAGSSSSDDGDGDDDSAEAKQKAFEEKVDKVAQQLKAAYASSDAEQIADATRESVLVSHEVASRQKAYELTEIQGMVEHGLHMGAVCPNCELTGPIGKTKGLGTHNQNVSNNADLQRERDELATELEKVKAAGTSDSALAEAKELLEDAEQEAEELRLQLQREKESKDTLTKEYEAATKRLDDFDRRYPRRPEPQGRKSASVGPPGFTPRTTSVKEPELPPQTFYEQQARRRKALQES